MRITGDKGCEVLCRPCSVPSKLGAIDLSWKLWSPLPVGAEPRAGLRPQPSRGQACLTSRVHSGSQSARRLCATKQNRLNISEMQCQTRDEIKPSLSWTVFEEYSGFCRLFLHPSTSLLVPFLGTSEFVSKASSREPAQFTFPSCLLSIC